MANTEDIIKAEMDKAGLSEGSEPADQDIDTDLDDAGTGDTQTPDDSGDVAAGGAKDEAAAGKVPAAKEDAQKAATDAEKAEMAFATRHGLVGKDGKRENRIPYSRTRKIIEKALKEQYKAFTGGDLADGKTLDDEVKTFFDGYTKIKAEHADFSTRLEEVGNVERIMLEAPEQFLQMLPFVNAKYAELLKPGTQVQPQGGGQVSAKPAASTDDPMPQPDHDLGNGQKTYSTQGIVKLLEWQNAQTEKRLIAQMDERYKPIQDKFQGDQRAQATWNKLQQLVNHARTNWRGFKENEDAILAKVTARKATSLDDAYRQVMDEVREAKDKEHQKQLDGLKADREKIRKEIEDEIRRQPKSTAAGGGAAASRTEESAGPRTTEQIIKDSMIKAGLSRG